MTASRPRTALDQVVRKQRFERAHPDVAIEHRTAPAWHWTAEWDDGDGSHRLVVNPELSGLLDELSGTLDG
jgi:hypothetical protein